MKQRASRGIDSRPANHQPLIFGQVLHEQANRVLVDQAVDDREAGTAASASERRLGLEVVTELRGARLRRCEESEVDPDPDLAQRMLAVLEAAGVIAPDDQ